MRGLLKTSVEFQRLVDVYEEEKTSGTATGNLAAFLASYDSMRGKVVENTDNWVWPDDFYEELGLWAECPCGNDGGWTDSTADGDGYQYVCDECGARGPIENSVKHAKEAWNRFVGGCKDA